MRDSNKSGSGNTKLVFEDGDGQRGIITGELDVEYAGNWEADVRECVERIENEYRSERDGLRNDVCTELVLELPEEAPIVEIRQIDEKAYT